MIDFRPVFKLLDDFGYKGWMVVEAEQILLWANPFEYAVKARKYIRETAGSIVVTFSGHTGHGLLFFLPQPDQEKNHSAGQFLSRAQGLTTGPVLRRGRVTGKASLHFRQRGLIHIRFHQARRLPSAPPAPPLPASLWHREPPPAGSPSPYAPPRSPRWSTTDGRTSAAQGRSPPADLLQMSLHLRRIV